MNPYDKNCSCERYLFKAIDICNIPPVPTVPLPPSPISVVENFVFQIQEEAKLTNLFTLTLPPITLTGNQKVFLEAESQVSSVTTSGPSFYVEDVVMGLRRDFNPLDTGSTFFRRMVKVNPGSNEEFNTPISLIYVDNPGPGIYTYSVEIQNASSSLVISEISQTIITATVYNV
ncbi:hypothetical protein [Lysinibacillus xylanilyticus]|uniref:hypothetical protein n=1 Tax=Lysinibacillus xylanilyticus TaxID=582475 RepID=UPI00380900E8